MRRVLLLGGSGFLGRHLLRSFDAETTAFAVARSAEGAERIRAACPAVTVVTAAETVGRRYDWVVNLVVDYGRGGAPLRQVMQSNLVDPLGMIERVEAELVLNVSTALPADYSHYALSKKLLEQSLTHLERQRDRPFVNIHLHNMYGPGGDTSELVGFTVARMLAGEPVELSDCTNARDFIHVDDVVAALAVIGRDPGAFARGEPVAIGTGRATPLRELVLLLRELTGSSSPLCFGVRPHSRWEPDAMRADITPLTRLGWRPRYALREGLARTLAAPRDRPGP